MPSSARRCCFPAWYEDLTRGPASTWANRSSSTPNARVSGELLGRDPPIHREVHGGRLEVLAHGQQVAVGVPEVAHGLGHLVGALAHPEDEVRLGDALRAEAAGDAQHVERPVVAERRPDPRVQPAHRLQVVGEHVGFGLHDRGDVPFPALEVGGQDLHRAARHGLPDRPDGCRPEACSAVGQVVAGHAGHHHVPEAHRRHRLRDPSRLLLVHRARLGGHDVAEPAAPGALLAEDQERGLPVLPALEDVGAAGLLAHRVEALAAHQALEGRVVRPHPGLNLEPGRLSALDGRSGGQDREVQPSFPRVVVDLGHRRPVYWPGG